MAEKWKTRRVYILLLVLLLVAILYLGSAGLGGGLGFPLDDAWIHQTYARNLVRWRQFAYVPGQTSAGSTAPLWTVLLAPGYLFGIDPLVWAYLLGMLTLLLLGIGTYRLGVRLFPDRPGGATWAAVAALGEWHLAWAAFSGMETLLFAAGVVWLLERYMAWEAGQRSLVATAHWTATPFVLGIAGGLLILVRPEGLLLIGLLAIAGGIYRRRRPVGRTLLLAGDALGGMALLIVPYLLFNLFTGGALFPNTLYAKQAEYAALLGLPLWRRLWTVLRNTLVGGQVLLLPGLVCAGICLGRRKQPANPLVGTFTRLAPFIWWGLSLLLYALRLPVGYQHGRYLMPTIPVLVLLGVMGTHALLCPRREGLPGTLPARVLRKGLPLAASLLFVAFLFMGARAYAHDVEVINCEMVRVARWLDVHTPAGAVVAAHDIGAIGYWADRKLLDLAGLVTPDVIPFVRDESRLLQFVLDNGADYLVTFPSWYPEMVQDPRLKQLYQTGCLRTRLQGGDNMAVYEVGR